MAIPKTEIKHPKVLIADDDRSITEGLSAILRDEGYDVAIAVDSIDGTRLTALGLPGAVAVIAAAPRGTLYAAPQVVGAQQDQHHPYRRRSLRQ